VFAALLLSVRNPIEPLSSFGTSAKGLVGSGVLRHK
jgi:hypothetical protein